MQKQQLIELRADLNTEIRAIDNLRRGQDEIHEKIESLEIPEEADAEMIAAMALQQSLDGIAFARENNARAAFRGIDIDQSGQVDSAELGKLMSGLGHKMTEQELQRLLDELDTDHDGVISEEEFLTLLSNTSSNHYVQMLQQQASSEHVEEEAASSRGSRMRLASKGARGKPNLG